MTDYEQILKDFEKSRVGKPMCAYHTGHFDTLFTAMNAEKMDADEFMGEFIHIRDDIGRCRWCQKQPPIW